MKNITFFWRSHGNNAHKFASHNAVAAPEAYPLPAALDGGQDASEAC